MRAICKDCTLSNVCNGECQESKAYDSGYNAAVEKAAKWIEDRFGESYIEYFRKAMEL